MYTIHRYKNEKLAKIWAGYIETETHIIWLPTGGGKPFVLDGSENQV